jgi:hypothetical protein
MADYVARRAVPAARAERPFSVRPSDLRRDALQRAKSAVSGHRPASIELVKPTLMSHSRPDQETGGATLQAGRPRRLLTGRLHPGMASKNHLGTPGKIKSEWSAASSGFATSFPRDSQLARFFHRRCTP